jgi:hypothetical protein
VPTEGHADTTEGIAKFDDEDGGRGIHGWTALTLRCGAVPKFVEAQAVLRGFLISRSQDDCKPPKGREVGDL